jgi:hypothetical protein
LAPQQERSIKATVIAPVENFRGRQAINVNGFANDDFIGGVTLFVEGT